MHTVSCIIAAFFICALPFLLVALVTAPVVLESVGKKGVRETVSEAMRRILGPIVKKLAYTEPLPQWTNVYLIGYALAIWAFAIGLNWWGDDRRYVIGGLVVLALSGLAIFGRVECQRN